MSKFEKLHIRRAGHMGWEILNFYPMDISEMLKAVRREISSIRFALDSDDSKMIESEKTKLEKKLREYPRYAPLYLAHYSHFAESEGGVDFLVEVLGHEYVKSDVLVDVYCERCHENKQVCTDAEYLLLDSLHDYLWCHQCSSDFSVEELQRMPYADYLRTQHWKNVRQLALDYAGHACQLCNASGGVLDVHHRTYERRGNEAVSDLTVLCRSCHAKFHDKEV